MTRLFAYLRWAFACTILISGLSPAQEEPGKPRDFAQFTITSAMTTLANHVYMLNAEVDYQFTPDVLEALESGVPITLNLRMEVIQPGELLWVWDKTFTSLEQRYQLEYHALSQQYLVKNLNTGIQVNFPTRQDAIHALGTIVNLPVLDQHLLTSGEHYIGRLQARLDIESLPAPLLLVAYFSKQWNLTSEWFIWPLQS